LEYRRISLDDIEIVLGMEGVFRDDFLKKECVTDFLKNSMNWIFVCILDNRIIGFIYGYELNRLNRAENMLYIHEVGILPDFQRKGIGTELIERLKKECHRKNIYKMFLFTQKSNIGACKLYDKTGGKTTLDSTAVRFNI